MLEMAISAIGIFIEHPIDGSFQSKLPDVVGFGRVQSRGRGYCTVHIERISLFFLIRVEGP